MQSPFFPLPDAPAPSSAAPPDEPVSPSSAAAVPPAAPGEQSATISHLAALFEDAPNGSGPASSPAVAEPLAGASVAVAPSFESVAPAGSSASSAPSFVPLDQGRRSPFASDPVHGAASSGAVPDAPVWKAGEPEALTAPRPGALAPLTAMLLGGALSCVLVGMGFVLGARNHGGTLDPVQQISGAYGGAGSDSGNAIVRAVKAVGPSVMNVDTTYGDGGSREIMPDPSEMGPHQAKGTGVVINSKEGLMLTNAHVVAGASTIQVTSPDGKKYSGRLIGADPSNDIALVQISNRNLPQARLATFTDPKQLNIGEWAIAIGNPFAQENTVTVGVISAVGRQVGPAPMPGKPGQSIVLTDMIQTDAAINPGNSGGPLCNIHGEVIGINTAILPMGQGLGFTIPINKAKAVAATLLRNGGKVPYIGIMMLSIDAKAKKDFALKDSKGIFVQKVLQGSPAAQAGLKNGDVILKADGQVLSGAEQIQKIVRAKKIGDSMQIEISRSGARRTLSIEIASMD